ncbi:hypothetical protein AALP_AA1G085600 [Arabis alpina]|uniref:Protein NO VEIN C-terminal domain-containing protein n=1 Tax=Arabis alpina TaxID=50452 RepID=A0A087HLZ3_ARAAL|nr:hypothetical protein AALP_AA1G085600 [Arabis alpina]
MQGNRDGSWSLRASANGGNGNSNHGYLPQSNRAYSNFNPQRPIRYNFQTHHNLNFPHQQIPTFPPHQFGDGGSRIHGSKSKYNVEIMRIDKVVIQTRKSLVASRENVSSTRVFQLILPQLQADSFRLQIQDVPSFRQLMNLEGKINAFIHCFIGARGIVTLHDLEVGICRNEMITSEEIVSFIDSYLNAYDMDDVELDEFLSFVAEKKLVTSKEKLGVRIQSLRMYVTFIQDAKRQEGETLKTLLTELHQKYHILSSKKPRQDKSLIVSEHDDLLALHHKDYCGKHTRFNSSSSDDNDDDEGEYVNSSDHFSSCPYPSIAEGMQRLPGSNKKRKAESRNREKYNPSEMLRRVPSKLRRGHVKQETPNLGDGSDAKQVFSVNEADFTLSEGALRLFISTWKDACKELSMSVFVEKILSFYNLGGSEVQAPIKRAKAMSSFPFVGLLHVSKELVTEALEEPIPSEITNTNFVAGFDNCAGTSSRASKPNPLRPMPMKSGSTSGNLAHEWKNSFSTDFSVRDQLHIGTPWAAQAQQTGKKGEEIAYRYFAAKYGKEAVVRWVNEQSETGLPYDLIIENRGGKKEYVEVKATVSTGKDYFSLTVKEWQFANEKGESYVIAHVLLGNSNAILTQHRNLVKLCQEVF